MADGQAAAVAAVTPAAALPLPVGLPVLPVGHLGGRGRRRWSRRLGRAVDLVEVADGGTLAGLPGDDQADLVILL